MDDDFFDFLEEDDGYDYGECYEHSGDGDDYIDDESLEEDDGYDYDRCYECSGYGDDYFVNDDGELECACPTCPFFEQ